MNVSNDQSPPVRKVIPYKQGGRRQSPFAEMAFQYSGTALDVAIQQRERDGVEELPPEVSADVGPPDGSQQAASPVPQAEFIKEFTPSATESQPVTADVKQEVISPAPLPIQNSEPIEQRQPVRGIRFVTGKKSKALDREAAKLDLQAFITRWKPFLTDAQIGVCTYVYDNSAAINQEYCFTSNERHTNFRMIDRDVISTLVSEEASRATSQMSKVYLSLINAPAEYWERDGVLRFAGCEREGECTTGWEQLVSLVGVASATARKAIRWMSEQGVIGYYAGRNGAGIRIFINLLTFT